MANEQQIKNYSIVKLAKYLYKVKFRSLAQDAGIVSTSGHCTSYIKDGKLYRNLDWNYNEGASFHIICPDFEGMAFLDGLTDTELDSSLIDQLPYHVCDGVNKYGIMVSTHVLFNDWNAIGKGSVPLTKLPFLALTRVESMETIRDDLDEVLNDLKTSSVTEAPVYLIQVIVSDGETTCLLRPKENSKCEYEIVDITSNPKLTNFRWVDKMLVVRETLQDHPTGVERWNLIPCDLSELRFTKAYETPSRLSEFIGIRNTTKDSSDEDLMKIYESAYKLYANRKRDGSIWQTMHSVVYSQNGMEHLWIQEDWEHDYAIKEEPKVEKEDTLAHYGVLGMKWGVRRYQNKDGTLTSAGKKRYGDEDKSEKSSSNHKLTDKQKKAIKVGAAVALTTLVAIGAYKLNKSGKLDTLIEKGKGEVDKLFKKAPNKDRSLPSSKKQRNKMSDDELAKRIARLEKETKLKELEKKNQDDGRTYAEEIIKDVGKRVITTASTGAVLYGGKVLIDKSSFTLRDLGNAVFRGGDKKK